MINLLFVTSDSQSITSISQFEALWANLLFLMTLSSLEPYGTCQIITVRSTIIQDGKFKSQYLSYNPLKTESWTISNQVLSCFKRAHGKSSFVLSASVTPPPPPPSLPTLPNFFPFRPFLLDYYPPKHMILSHCPRKWVTYS